MSEKRTYGLKSVKTADPSVDGTMPTALTELCRTYKDSCEFTEDDAQITEEFCDQEDDPIETFSQKGSKSVKFSTFDYSPETLKKLKGGTIVEGKWAEPTNTPEIIQAVEITTATGMNFSFPKARILAKFNSKFVKNGLSLIEVTIKPMSPGPGKPAVLIGDKTP
ncbi:hypothetical protein [Flavobacterium sp. HSC-61S13]|uniref:hypothetical protein n=1 Tax=Flavobacterium sp. HSC-61S13 TaxID=2910963 RepID=UPI00209CFE19|nr:hypothetical protein [Flavobacterium sp. HSC-61S13]MCP1997299.1 hypothetical protein [Flavobacterium sp. HSC-61S13]